MTTNNSRFALLLSVFCLLVFISCRNECRDVSCLNEGVCDNGRCICKEGYSGERCELRNASRIRFVNAAFTPVSVITASDTQTVPIGGTLTFDGRVGDVFNGVAMAYVSDADESLMGEAVTWALSADFPPSGTIDDTLGVPPLHYLLSVVNNAGESVVHITINSGHSGMTELDVNIPSDGKTYNIGYFRALSEANVLLTGTAQSWNYSVLNLSGESNQRVVLSPL